MRRPEDALRHARVAALFMDASALPPEKRAALLDRECGGDATLRREVEELLACDREDSFLRPPDPSPSPPGPSADLSAGERVSLLPERIGPCRVLRLLGRGAMGVVYEAEQSEPRRRVALKTLRADALGPETLRRFRREAAALARLQHPGIATLFEAGTAADPESGDHGEIPWFAMELVQGVPLTTHARERGLDRRARVGLLLQVCDAVEHAHAQGVIHRDLKPANILVDAAGRAKVLDFGVARLTDTDLQTVTQQTATGEFVGTLPYMSPEQVRSDPGRLDARTDIYALGVLAYELLSGTLPITVRGTSLAGAVRRILEEEPDLLGTRDSALRGDLENVVAKALEKEPARRYARAAEFAADLRRWLEHRPVTARATSVWEQARKFARRNRGLVVGLLVAFAVLLAALVVLGVMFVELRHRNEQTLAANEQLDQLMAQAIRRDVPRLERTLGAQRERAALLDTLRQVDAARRKMRDGAGDPKHRLATAEIDYQLGVLELEEGHADTAQNLQREAFAIRDELTRELPFDAELTRQYSLSLVKMGDLAIHEGDPVARQRYHTLALILDEWLVTRFPERLDLHDRLAWGEERMMDLSQQQGRTDLAALYLLRRQCRCEWLAETAPDEPEYRFHLATSSILVATCPWPEVIAHLGEDPQEKQLALLREARRLADDLITERPADAAFTRIWIIATKSNAEREPGLTLDERLRGLERAARAAELALVVDPDRLDFARLLVAILWRAASWCSDAGRLSESEPWILRALPALRKLEPALGVDEQGSYEDCRAHLLWILGTAELARGEVEAGTAHQREALEIQPALDKRVGTPVR